MTKKAKAALEESIAHWRRLATGKRKEGEDCSSDDCALCAMFFKPTTKNGVRIYCMGCPVRNKTGNSHCDGTPYTEAAGFRDDMDSFYFRDAAKRELNFLITLRPKTKKPKTTTKL